MHGVSFAAGDGGGRSASAAAARPRMPLRRPAARPGGDGAPAGGTSALIAEDEPLLRDGLAAILEAAGYDVVGLASDAEELLRKARAHRPALLVVDVVMPPLHRDDGLRAASELRGERSDLAVMVLSQYVEVSYLFTMLRGDASGIGYMLKQRISRTQEFLDALERVVRGGSAIDPEVVSAMMGRTVLDDPLRRLTARQREVLGLIAEGYSNAAIAERLVLSEQTVESHISAIMAALDLQPSPDVHRRVAAVLRFLEASGP